MRDYREKQLALLAELDKACRENDIPYVLSCYTARSAYMKNGFPERIATPSIAMHYKHAVKLKAALESKERAFESSVENRKIPRNVLRYSDPDTTALNVSELGSIDCGGIAVEIELIRDVPKNHKLNRLFILAEVAAALAANLRSSSKGWRSLLSIFSGIERIILKSIYNYRNIDGKRLRISRFPRKSIEFPASFLKERQQVLLEGRSFCVPEDMERYMQTEFDANWRTTDVEKAVEDIHLTVFSSDMDYKQSLEYIRPLDANGAKIPWIRWFILRGRMRFLRGRIESYWDMLFSTKVRFDMWRKYMPQKDEIRWCFEQEDTESLSALFADYFEQLKKYEKKGIAICFDKEIFEIALSVLRREGKNSFADRLQSIVRPEHLEPIRFGEN